MKEKEKRKLLYILPAMCIYEIMEQHTILKMEQYSHKISKLSFCKSSEQLLFYLLVIVIIVTFQHKSYKLCANQ